MLHLIIRPFIRLLATSPEIERLPFVQRPRTMAATWAGLLVCKVGAMVLLSPAIGAELFVATLVAGIAATYVRFGLGGQSKGSMGPRRAVVRRRPASPSRRTRSLRPCGRNCR